jgi:hypothetical protein
VSHSTDAEGTLQTLQTFRRLIRETQRRAQMETNPAQKEALQIVIVHWRLELERHQRGTKAATLAWTTPLYEF